MYPDPEDKIDQGFVAGLSCPYASKNEGGRRGDGRVRLAFWACSRVSFWVDGFSSEFQHTYGRLSPFEQGKTFPLLDFVCTFSIWLLTMPVSVGAAVKFCSRVGRRVPAGRIRE
jgi:hypothetical protein